MTATADTRPTGAPVRRKGGVRRAIAVLALGLLAVAIVAPGLALGRVLQAAAYDDTRPTDAIVVLGAAQFWGRPSPVLEARLDHAKALFAADVAPRIITVGGKQPRDITTEAQAGKDWLVEAGVPRKGISAVPTGSDTVTSLTAVAALMAERGWTSATIVTDPAHVARSLAIAGALGIEAHGSPTSAGDGSSLTLDYVVRETGGLLWFWLVGRRDVTPVVGT